MGYQTTLCAFIYIVFGVFSSVADISEIVQPPFLPGEQFGGVQPSTVQQPAQADGLEERFYTPIDVTDQCLNCLCYAISDCDLKRKCGGDICGPYGITWAFWADAGKPTIPGETIDSKYAYADCANDINCASVAIRNYMSKFGQDCNRDGVINCYDVGAIHQLGAYSCGGNLTLPFYNKFKTCAFG